MASVKDTVTHEVAHFLALFAHHGREFRDTLFALGGRDLTDDPGYMKYGLYVPWKRVAKFGVEPRFAYTKEIFVEKDIPGYSLDSSCDTDSLNPLAMISSVIRETFLFPRSKSDTYVRRRPK
jgi:hypothetical protein